MNKTTLKEEYRELLDMDGEQISKVWDELWNIPVDIPQGGNHKGMETIQRRFHGFRRGTPRFFIEEWLRIRLYQLKERGM